MFNNHQASFNSLTLSSLHPASLARYNLPTVAIRTQSNGSGETLMSAITEAVVNEFAWEVQPAAAQWVRRAISLLAARNPNINRLERVLLDFTGTRLSDWLDHLTLDGEMFPDLVGQLAGVGYTTAAADRSEWRHPLGMFPAVITDIGSIGLALRCESIEAALVPLPAAIGLHSVDAEQVIGHRGSDFRYVSIDTHADGEIWLVERHGYPGFAFRDADSTHVRSVARHAESFRRRERAFDAPAEGFAHASQLFAAAAADLGTAWACDLFFAAEREYWQSRSHAGQMQYERQQRLGLGWANHDHHTYRSSRAAFSQLVTTLEQMGFVCRERFYAGREAGWGAQVLEQPDARVVIFADVDLSPEEVAGDFAHEPLAERSQLGTVGLWCELHGEAFLEAGMHHLECQFDFDAARAELAAAGIETMAPFTDFPFLKQAFTKGEMWPVEPRRIERLVAAGRITADQADRFRREGALGSHLEILERNEGYKGFNQTGISEIITRTDPRRTIGA
jgi:hypothetical protein